MIDDRFLTANYARQPVEFVRGAGARLWDADGTEYLDLQTGLAVNSVGHCHPAVVAAIRAQAGDLIHVGNLFYTDPMVASGGTAGDGCRSSATAPGSSSPTAGPRPSRPP